MCKKHNKPMQGICNIPVCGFCYEEMLLTEKYIPRKKFEELHPWMFKSSIIRSLDGHLKGR